MQLMFFFSCLRASNKQFTTACVRDPTHQATDALTGTAERARCLSLLADLALDLGCARTLFQRGAVPQMLLDAQGCRHGGSTASDGGGGGGFSDGGASPTPSAKSMDSEMAGEVTGRAGVTKAQLAQTNGEVCRCRQAVRLLCRLVRGLPGEAPGVVVRHSGLLSIVQILEEAAAAAASTDRGGRVPAATEAAAGEALEVRSLPH